MKKSLNHNANTFDQKKATDYLSKVGLEKEKNDCTVRAVSNAFSVDYSKAHEFLATLGRKPKHGIHFGDKFGRKDGKVFDQNYFYYSKPGRTIEKFLEDYPKGTFLILVRKHATVVIDGKVVDTTTNLPGTRVKEFYSIGKEIKERDFELLADEVSIYEKKGDVVEHLYAEGLTPSEITKVMLCTGFSTTEGSVRCFIRSINENR